MTTYLVIGLVWVIVTLPFAMLVGRALRAAGCRDERHLQRARAESWLRARSGHEDGHPG